MSTVSTTCQWYAMCDNDAAGVTPHPVLGNIPICQRCADRHDLIVDFDPNNPNADLLPDPAEGWFDDRANLVTLCEHLANTGHDASTIAHAVEKPWHYVDEFKLAVFSVMYEDQS